MVDRKISLEKYAIAGIITFLVFVLGLALGLLVDNLRADESEMKIKMQEVDYNSLQLQYLLLNDMQNTESTCPVIHIALQESIKQLSKSLHQIEEYSENSHLPNERFEIIRRRYVLDNIRYWMLASKSKELCNISLLPILYFYSEDKCVSCPNQGTTLTYYKKKFGDSILIFPIDFDLREKESMISILSAHYNVTTFPTLIINNQKYEGIVNKDKLGEIICQNFKEDPLCQN